jgi:tRNA (adenine57-N1/adenine58-N1)-methyltransferase
MRPDPHLFSLSLKHKTQILFQADISMVLHLLNLKPGDIIFESGTGSCSLTYSLSQRVGPSGKVFTFEFNNGRYQNALEVTTKMQMANVRCHWQNVLDNGFVVSEFLEKCTETQKNQIKGNTDIVPLNELSNIQYTQMADAVFLDLPSPELVVPHANKVLKRGGKLCSFSPCIEQIQETAKALSRLDYSEFKTVEILEREMRSKWIGDTDILAAKEGKMGLYIDSSDQKMHTGYLIFATKF